MRPDVVSSIRFRNAPNTPSFPGSAYLGIHRTRAHQATPPVLQTRKLDCEPTEVAAVPAYLNEPLLPQSLDNAFAELIPAKMEHCPPIQQWRGPKVRRPANGCTPRTSCGSDPTEPASVADALGDWQCARLFFRAWKTSLSSFDGLHVEPAALEIGHRTA